MFYNICLLIPFQFHKGTIRTPMSTAFGLNMQQFQFHKGTIRTEQSKIIIRITDEFQFHKGTIRTKPLCERD